MAPSPSSAPSAERSPSRSSETPSPEAPSAPRATRRIWPLLEAGLLVAAALWGLWFQLTISHKSIPDADYRAVAKVLAQDAKPGDVVLLYPWWTDRARLFLPEGVPIVGYLGSDDADLTTHPRIWVLAAPGLPGSDLKGFVKGPFARDRAVLPLDGKSDPRGERFGKLSLALYRNDRARQVLWSAVDHLAQARVSLQGPNGESEPCPWDGGGFRCAGNLRVAAEWHEIFYQPRRCLFMHAPGGPVRLVAEFDHVPAAATLRVASGIIWEHAWKHDPGLTPYRVGVADGSGTRLGELEIPVGKEGLQHVDIPFQGGAPDRTVRISVQSDAFPERDGCVEVTALGGHL